MNDKLATPSLKLENIVYGYGKGETRLDILRDAHFTLYPGETVALVAPSGTGKSTLLHIAGLLDAPDKGEVSIGGVPASGLDDDERTRLRRLAIGFVYQFHHLLPEFSAQENVALPQLMRGLNAHEAYERARQLLAWLGLGARVSHRPGELSGGEQQRVAIARAVANVPRVLLADEPTGNLDPVTAGRVFDSLSHLVKATHLSALVATHNLALAARMDRCVTLKDGQIVDYRP
jgi:lipoprotein-releasing system ATP-binding protein